jgi:nucleotide-binding universal stress UspA family protein
MRIGDPAESILIAERELNVDLIVMATHGRSGVGRLLLGSIADQVARSSRAPVVLLRAGQRSPDELKTMLVPLDGTPRGALALSLAVPLARASHASLVLVQASRSSLQTAETHANRTAAQLRRVGLVAEGRGFLGPPGTAIVSAADDVDADLIVMSTHGRGGRVRTVLGSVANDVVRRSKRSVLLVRRASHDTRDAPWRPRAIHAAEVGQTSCSAQREFGGSCPIHYVNPEGNL